MVFREITAEDVPDLFGVRVSTRENALTEEELQRLGITPETVCRMLAGSHLGWLCEVDGVVVGFAMANGETGEMWVIAVLPGCEGMGIGTGLMGRVEGWLWSLGWREIWLTTDTDTSLRAYGFYRARGWKDWKVEDGDLFMRRANPNSKSDGEGV